MTERIAFYCVLLATKIGFRTHARAAATANEKMKSELVERRETQETRELGEIIDLEWVPMTAVSLQLR